MKNCLLRYPRLDFSMVVLQFPLSPADLTPPLPFLFPVSNNTAPRVLHSTWEGTWASLHSWCVTWASSLCSSEHPTEPSQTFWSPDFSFWSFSFLTRTMGLRERLECSPLQSSTYKCIFQDSWMLSPERGKRGCFLTSRISTA